MSKNERNLWDDGRVECGDIMHRHADGHVSRRLCGGCSALVDTVDDDDRIVGNRMARPEGCSDVLETEQATAATPPSGAIEVDLGADVDRRTGRQVTNSAPELFGLRSPSV